MSSVELIQERAGVIAQVRALVNGVENEKRSMTVEEQEKSRSLFAAAEELGAKIGEQETKEKLAEAEAQLRAVAPRKVGQQSHVAKRSMDEGEAKELFRSWALAGTHGHRPDADTAYRASENGFNIHDTGVKFSHRALSKSGSAGGYTVAQAFQNQLDKALSYYFSVQSVADVFSTSDGSDMPQPTVDDTSSSNNAAIVAEASGIGTTLDPTFGTVTFKSFDYYSPIVKVSNQLLRDSAQDIGSVLADLFGERMGRAMDAACVSTNAGSSAPEGMLYGVTAAVNLATGTPNPITIAKLLELESQVDLAYLNLPGSGFLMHPGTWSAIRAMAESTGRLLLNSDLSTGTEKRLLGYPVHLSKNITSIATGGDNVPLILFGALKKYRIRLVGGSTLTRLNELYAGNGQVGFCLHSAWDARWINKAGVRTLNSFDTP